MGGKSEITEYVNNDASTQQVRGNRKHEQTSF